MVAGDGMAEGVCACCPAARKSPGRQKPTPDCCVVPHPPTLTPLMGQSTPQCWLLTTKERSSLPRWRLNEITRHVTGYMLAACCRPQGAVMRMNTASLTECGWRCLQASGADSLGSAAGWLWWAGWMMLNLLHRKLASSLRPGYAVLK